MLKKSIAMLLTLSLCFSLASVAFAAETTKISAEAQTLVSRFDGDVKKDRALLRQVSNDLDRYPLTSLSNHVEIDSVDVNGTATYKIEYREVGITDYITIEEDGDGNTVIDITEGDKHNVVVLTTDGRTLLDGFEVTVGNSTTSATVQQTPGLVRPLAGQYHRVFGVQPSLSSQGLPVRPNGFHATGTSYYGPNISLGQQIASISTSALIIAIVGAAGTLIAGAIHTLIVLAHAEEMIRGALTFRKSQLALIANQCGGADALSVRVTEYAKDGNDSLYSEWYYAVTLYMAGGTHYSAAKKTSEAT